jgi:hypothetical protein
VQYRHWKYPYGFSHSCDKILFFALQRYAEEHAGAFPAGEETPEASLSLLYPDVGAEILRGKTVPREIVEPLLKSGARLGPDTCGWHYVEGLRLDDDSHLALAWDKVGLGHNGQRLENGGHYVIFIHEIDFIPGDRWEEFLEQQRDLLVRRSSR